MTRRCSHCSKDGHNSRTCPSTRSGSGSGGVKLFGVRLTEGVGSMKKSASMGNLSSSSSSHFSSSSSPNNNNQHHHQNPGSPSSDPTRDHARSGYASDDPNHTSCSSSNSRSERKKGTPWTEEEHRMFLLGLQKLGKGDWRGIARNFVVSRTPTQVASHAQKYFIRQTNATRRKRRSSLFDIVAETQTDQHQIHDEQLMLQSPQNEPENANQLMTSLQLSQDQEPEPAESASDYKPTPDLMSENISYNNIPLPPAAQAFYPAFIPVIYPFWPPRPTAAVSNEAIIECHEVLKPTPVHLSKEPKNVDEIVGLSKLSIGDGTGPAGQIQPSGLTLKLMDAPTSRQSAFHVNPTIAGADLSPRNRNPIHAV